MSKRNNWSLLFALPLLGGCADYLNHNETLTVAAGDSNRANRMLQTEDPFGKAAYDTEIGSDGARAVRVVRTYQEQGIRQVPAGGKTGQASSLPK